VHHTEIAVPEKYFKFPSPESKSSRNSGDWIGEPQGESGGTIGTADWDIDLITEKFWEGVLSYRYPPCGSCRMFYQITGRWVSESDPQVLTQTHRHVLHRVRECFEN
jgi:hypothetical protein